MPDFLLSSSLHSVCLSDRRHMNVLTAPPAPAPSGFSALFFEKEWWLCLKTHQGFGVTSPCLTRDHRHSKPAVTPAVHTHTLKPHTHTHRRERRLPTPLCAPDVITGLTHFCPLVTHFLLGVAFLRLGVLTEPLGNPASVGSPR